MSLRDFFSSREPLFQKGGKYQKFYPIFEMVETIFFTSNTVTKVAPHARSFVDMKRIMTYVVIATLPCVLWAFYNTGLQTNTALSNLKLDDISGWRIFLLQFSGLGINPDNILANFIHGALYFFLYILLHF
jgi:Na+-transporting NADH:ubiquinone oxidoreductase subunit B